MVSTTLSTMAQQPVPNMQPKSSKAGAKHDEHRDTTRPSMVTELFIGVMRGMGTSSNVTAIRKNTRDEVLWDQASAPWRRSPMWLLIRVTLQLVITWSSDGSHELYKEVMVFIMGHILQSARQARISGDLRYAMQAKIHRRMYKLQIAGSKVLPQAVRSWISKVLQKTTQDLSKAWEVAQKDYPEIQLSALAALDLSQDSLVDLSALNGHIHSTFTRWSDSSSSRIAPSTSLVKYLPYELPTIPLEDSNDKSYATVNYHALERWVEQHLDDWLDAYIREDACEQLTQLMMEYYSRASKQYAGNPEGMSIMLLTIFELWVAIDKAATYVSALLEDFKPGVPPNMLQNLLLPFSDQMKRLAKVETYLANRESREGSKATSYLFSTQDPQDFPSQYYTGSPLHQTLLADIEKNANEARSLKMRELDQVQAEYHRLDNLYRPAEHDRRTYMKPIDGLPNELEPVIECAPSCPKCFLRRSIRRLNITVHEWPLPQDPAEAQAVVFELQVPAWFAHWRDARQYLLVDVLKGGNSDQAPRTLFRLSSDDPHLKRHFRGPSSPRIGLVSCTKSVCNTHYSNKNDNTNIASLRENEVCVRNGLRYKYFDEVGGLNVGSLHFTDEMPWACTYRLPQQALRKFPFRPESAPDGPSPNAVIASQESCPENMTLEEYKELCTLPLGHRIQWPNILLQLAMPGVDFKKPETTLVFLQCIYQAGPPGLTALRESHDFLKEQTNSRDLLNSLIDATHRVKENWESAQAVYVFVAIAARILSLSSSFPHIRSRCLEFLNYAREILLRWTIDLREKAHAAGTNEDRTIFLSKSVEIALICIATYDVDDYYQASILSSRGNASILVQSCIVLREATSGHFRQKELHLKLLYFRARCLLHRIYGILADNRDGLDDAIKKSWSAYMPGKAGWSPVSEAADHWLTTHTAALHGDSMTVHYNLLTGKFLVDGLPLGQPPETHRDHPLYSTLFGKAMVEVMPSKDPGFQFSTKRAFHGYAVHLGVVNATRSYAGDLVVKATKANRSYETIPARLMEGAYPGHFVHDYVHWFDPETHTIQFRPADEPWNDSSIDAWTLSKPPGQRMWRLSKAGCSLVGLASPTSNHVSRVLRPLIDRDSIHNVAHPDSTLHISISCLRMGFSLRSESSLLESREYRNMVVDDDQSIGTLFGLVNKLVLKPKAEGHRMLLLPESRNASYERNGNHVMVEIAKDSITSVHALQVDTQLGRLVDNGDLNCKLYLAYFHALTSSYLVDPLIQRTGTEQALAILNSAAVRSFEQLSQDYVEMLAKLADLTPKRRYYPQSERVMQTIQWDPKLSPFAQHGHFVTAVKQIYDQAVRAQIFFPGVRLQLPDLDHIDEHLLQRDDIRSATFRVSGFGAEDHTCSHDFLYPARDRNLLSLGARNAASMSNLIFRDGTDLPIGVVEKNVRRIRCLWDEFREFDVLYGSSSSPGEHSFQYNARLLEDGIESMLKRLPAIHSWLSGNVQGRSRPSKFAIIIWLSTMAFTASQDRSILIAVAMFFKSPALGRKDLVTPPRESFQPSADFSFDEAFVNRLIKSHSKPIDQCPEINLTKRPKEKVFHFEARKQLAWENESDRDKSRLLAILKQQGPSENPTVPDDETAAKLSEYLDLSAILAALRPKFKVYHGKSETAIPMVPFDCSMGAYGALRLTVVLGKPVFDPFADFRSLDNILLFRYLDKLDKAIAGIPVQKIQLSRLVIGAPSTRSSPVGHLSERSLFQSPPPDLPAACDDIGPAGERQYRTSRRSSSRLGGLIQRLETAAGQLKYESGYVLNLKGSLEALLQREDGQSALTTAISGDILSIHLSDCREHAVKIYDLIVAALLATFTDTQVPHQWLRISPMFLLRQLIVAHWKHLSEAWKVCTVKYGIALTAVQRAERLLKLTDRPEDIVRELSNPGHTNWNPMDFPESLLMEVESGVMIRPVQEDIAKNMRQPPDDCNRVMQLNMGEGKSSVIVPIVAAALANGKRLVRVIVAKPQSKQMAQMLVSKVGGLLNRRVYYMPSSRALKLNKTAALVVSDIVRECMSSGGILVQPEHLLPFKLMAPECYISGNQEIGVDFMKTQDFFDIHSRDIVDESDENFSVHFELIYTMGKQRGIELSLDRWLLLQQVLDIVCRIAPGIVKELPSSLNYHPGVPGSFPRTRILRPDAQALLLERVAQHVCDHGLNGLQLARQPENVRKSIFTYITKFELDSGEISAVENSLFWTNATETAILFLRGLIAGVVLAFALAQKRWRVNYGLATRTPPTKLAVPYRAKDSTSLRSEFSHPNVVITLTSLCYYYGGLSDEDLFTAMGHLLESDQADVEYQAWVRDGQNMPAAFKTLQGVNLKDGPQCVSLLFPALRYTKAVIDYFLSHIVFAKEMREFPDKLTASGWDIGKKRNMLLTGFSGTNDSRLLLPLNVYQLDLDGQKHTNALVLENILQPKNGVELLRPAATKMSDAEHLLDAVLRLEPGVQVILDVGAQILEMNNLEVSKAWLRMHDSSKQAAVFVNDQDELCVVDRNGRIDPLRTSSYFTRLDLCLVFLDEAHTRGIELQLPTYYRAAVTLGAKLTKDRLVQACMRMRKHGKGQTVVFCISQEIQAKILECTSKESSADINVEDVLL
jgi:hypothetical protein